LPGDGQRILRKRLEASGRKFFTALRKELEDAGGGRRNSKTGNTQNKTFGRINDEEGIGWLAALRALLWCAYRWRRNRRATPESHRVFGPPSLAISAAVIQAAEARRDERSCDQVRGKHRPMHIPRINSGGITAWRQASTDHGRPADYTRSQSGPISLTGSTSGARSSPRPRSRL